MPPENTPIGSPKEISEHDFELKKAEKEKLLAEADKIRFEKKTYWLRNIVAFLSLGGILSFVINFAILPVVESQVHEQKQNLRKEQRKVNDQEDEIDSLKFTLEIRDDFIVRLEDSLSFVQENLVDLETSIEEIQLKLTEKQDLLDQLIEERKKPASQQQPEKIVQLTTNLGKINDDVRKIEVRQDSVKEREFKTLCDTLVENIVFQKCGGRYCLRLPKEHPAMKERILVKSQTTGKIVYNSYYNQINKSTLKYTYLRSVERKIGRALKLDRSDYVVQVEVICEGKVYYIDLTAPD